MKSCSKCHWERHFLQRTTIDISQRMLNKSLRVCIAIQNRKSVAILSRKKGKSMMIWVSSVREKWWNLRIPHWERQVKAINFEFFVVYFKGIFLSFAFFLFQEGWVFVDEVKEKDQLSWKKFRSQKPQIGFEFESLFSLFLA